MKPKVNAIIVTYQPENGFIDRLAVLLAQVDYMVIVNNGSSQEMLEKLMEFSDKSPKSVTIINSAENVGIAGGQNLGLSVLPDNGDWVLFMDDDSLPEPDMVSKMLMAYAEAGDKNIGIVAPRLVEKNIDFPSRHLMDKKGWVFERKVVGSGEVLRDVLCVISSGSMVKSQVLHKIGYMRTGFFMDYVDHEFCVRAVMNGYKIMVAGDAVLNHKQGNKRYDKIAGITIKTSNYGAERYYYIFRNRMFFLRLYGAKKTCLISHEFLACLVDMFRVISAEECKLDKLGKMFRGLWDGLLKPLPTPFVEVTVG